MLKTTLRSRQRNKNPEQGDRKSPVDNQDKKKQIQKVFKTNEWQNRKIGFVPKKQRLPELKTLISYQDYS